MEGKLDFSAVALPIIFVFGILYATMKTLLGYWMQPRRVRQWKKAQWDLQICVYLTHFALLTLAASLFLRGVETIYIVSVVIGIVGLSSGLLSVGFTFLIRFFFSLTGRRALDLSNEKTRRTFLAWFDFGTFVLAVLSVVVLGILATHWQWMIDLMPTLELPRFRGRLSVGDSCG